MNIAAPLKDGSKSVADMMSEIGSAARAAARELANATTASKNEALRAAASELRQNSDALIDANRQDVEVARPQNKTAAFIDRLTLDEHRVEAMAAGLDDIAALPDPVGDVIAEWDRPNGLRIERVRQPIGVIGIIYESRPNVTSDAGGLCLKSGNVAVLRGGSDSYHSALAIQTALHSGLRQAGLTEKAIQVVPTADRDAVGLMLSGLGGCLDLIIPRGGKSLVKRVHQEARVPVFAHLEGVCHVYVDKAADLRMAKAIVHNAKMRRTGICGAMETLLVDEAGADRLLEPLVTMLLANGCNVRGDARTQAVSGDVVAATDDDWPMEYLEAIVAVKTVDGVSGALDHIARYGSQHTEAIVTDDAEAAGTFLDGCGSAIVMHNASTQFADGGEFGMGAEIGIATGKMHARGPVGVEQLTTFRYIVRGNGQVRPD